MSDSLPENLLAHLARRHAAKAFLPSRPLPEPALRRIVEAARLAPSSSGLEPVHLFLVKHSATRDAIAAACFGQAQVTEAPHLLVFAVWDDYTPERINTAFDRAAKIRGAALEEEHRAELLTHYPPRGAAVNFAHAARQAYIALGFALAQAAAEGVDCIPMEGFQPEAVDRALALPAQGLRSVLLLPLGFHDPSRDWLAPRPKTRRPMGAFLTEV